MWIDISAEHLKFWSGWIGVEKLGEIHCSWRALTKSLVALLWRSWRCKKFVQSAYSQVFTNVHAAKKVHKCSQMFIQRKKVHKCPQMFTQSRKFTSVHSWWQSCTFFALFWRLYQLSSCSARTMEKRRRKSKSVSKEFRSAHADINILKENAFLLKQLREVLAVVFVVMFSLFSTCELLFLCSFYFSCFFLISPRLCFLDFPWSFLFHVFCLE